MPLQSLHRKESTAAALFLKLGHEKQKILKAKTEGTLAASSEWFG
jgi:hypothetical protein|tara:strand:+ start:3379 stop:3513 length:135 start_codon:yes stop_codon:yes gene_type:complete